MAIKFQKNGVTLEFLDPGKIDAIWPSVEKLVDRLEKKAVHGEFTKEDVKDLAKKGIVGIGVAYDDDGIFMLMAFEDVVYPKATAVNVLAMAGERLDEFMTLFLPPFKDFLRNQGVSWIECNVSPGMERMHHRYGFKTVYRNLRLEV